MKIFCTRQEQRSKFRSYRFINLTAIALLFTAGCSPPPSRDLSEYSRLPAVKTYLADRVCSTGFKGKAYAAYEVLGADSEGNREQLYLWVLCQEFYQKNGEILQGTGSSLPVRLTIDRTSQGLTVLNHQASRSGSLYAEDLRTLFPERIINTRSSQTTEMRNQRVKQLQDEVKAEASKK